MMIVLIVFIGCRKDLCYDHFSEVDLQLEVVYSLDWHLPWDENWNEYWPDEWAVDWNKMLPKEPEGVRLHIFDCDYRSPISNHNLECKGGRIALNSGYYDMLLYNNDTEGIIFENMNAVSDAGATTRTRSKSAIYSTRYPDETTASPPDMLFAGYLPECELRKPNEEKTLFMRIEAKLTPRTWTYLVRYEFTSGQEYVSEAQAYLSGMAGRVCLKDGRTDNEKVITLLLDCNTSTCGFESIVRSFGLPGFDYEMVRQRVITNEMALLNVSVTNKLVLEMKLMSGKVKLVEFDVSSQVRKQPRGGVIVVKDIVVTSEEGQKPNGSGFEGEVSDWEENIDVDVPIS